MSSTMIDSIIRIKNAYAARREIVELKYSKMIEKIISLLAQEKYIKGYRVDSKEGKIAIVVDLLYDMGKSAITGLKLSSKPGRRIYTGAYDLKPVLGGMGITVLTTSKGIQTDKTARKLKVGGEVLFQIW